MGSSAVTLEDVQPQAVVWYIDGQLYSDATVLTAILMEFATYNL